MKHANTYKLDYEDLLKNQLESRKREVEKLNSYLQNPGRFSILLLGKRGTGKSFWLEKIQEVNSKIPFSKGVKFINALLIEPSVDSINKLLFDANKKYLVIEDVEKLSSAAQELLFEAFSTSDGKYGIGDKKYECRIIFTSSFDIKYLRDTEQYLSHKFFDRVSQLVVELPSFADSQRSVWKDFVATWHKMDYQEKNDIPSTSLQLWIEKTAHKFHGNFRDLDKIVINWHQLRLAGIKEPEILSLVINDFEKYFHFPEHRVDLSNAYHIEEGKTYDQLLKDFRMQVKIWAKSVYGTLRKAEKDLGVSYRTMERW